MEKVAVIQAQSMVSLTHPEKGITTGGTQRYAIQLAKLMKEKGYQVHIIARANKPYPAFAFAYGQIVIVAAPLGVWGDYRYSKSIFEYCTEHHADFVCYVDLMSARWFCYPGSIALQHGIGWDGPLKLRSKIKRFLYTREYLKAIQKFEKIVCVDTNFINWARENDPHFFEKPEKYYYLPNFADESLFPYSYSEWTEDMEFVLLYPRRLVAYRGYKIFIDMCEALKAKGYRIHPVLAFEENASDDYKALFADKLCDYEIIHPGLEEIAKEYQRAFLTYVPTIWSEGTSLSAIESICSGCPVLCSNVGGLGNVMIPGFTGEIVSPTVDEFVKATEEVLLHPEIRNRWAKNCENLRKSFTCDNWNKKFLDYLEK